MLNAELCIIWWTLEVMIEVDRIICQLIPGAFVGDNVNVTGALVGVGVDTVTVTMSGNLVRYIDEFAINVISMNGK
jgi:hypothetical protein